MFTKPLAAATFALLPILAACSAPPGESSRAESNAMSVGTGGTTSNPGWAYTCGSGVDVCGPDVLVDCWVAYDGGQLPVSVVAGVLVPVTMDNGRGSAEYVVFK